jgi:peptide/nickel transport system substrate-binding protein
MILCLFHDEQQGNRPGPSRANSIPQPFTGGSMIRSSVSHLSAFIAAAVLSVSLAVDAKTLRWSSAGDVSTHDPHAQNESFNNQFNGQIYEQLLSRDKNMQLIGNLATEWKQTSPTTWVFNLRKGVKWHDGSNFTADDVMFSIVRAQAETSQMRVYANDLGKVKKIDDYTVELTTPGPNPVLPDMVGSGNIFIMSKAWSEKNKVEKPQDFKNKEETFAVRNAMGTGPFMLLARAGRADRDQEKPQLVGIERGQVRRQRERGGVPANQGQWHTRGRAALG